MSDTTTSRTPVSDIIQHLMDQANVRRRLLPTMPDWAKEIHRHLPAPYTFDFYRGQPSMIVRADDLGEVQVLALDSRSRHLPPDVIARIVRVHEMGISEGRRIERVRGRQRVRAQREAAEVEVEVEAYDDAPAAPGMR
ncbi:hypothetical protein ACUXK4_004553 [Methylorubrum extorquens]